MANNTPPPPGYVLTGIARLPGENQGLPPQPTIIKREVAQVDPLFFGESAQNNRARTPPPTHDAERLVEHQSPSRPPAVDIIEIMTKKFLSLCRTTPLDTSTVAATVSGVQIFAGAYAWKHVIDLSSKLLTDDGPSGISNGGMLSLMSKLRLEGLYRMKMFDELVHESNKILLSEQQRLSAFTSTNATNSSLEGTNEPACSTTIDCELTVAMKLLQAEIKAITGRGDDALGQLYVLQKSLIDPSQPVTNSEFWSWRIRGAIVNAAIRQRQWRVAIKELISISKDIKKQMTTVAEYLNSRGHLRANIIVLCRLSRILLQIGAVSASNTYCEMAKRELALGTFQGEGVENYVNITQGLVLFGQDKYEEAFSFFRDIVTSEKARVNESSSTVSCSLGAMGALMDGSSTASSALFDFPSAPLSSAETSHRVCAGILEIEESFLSMAVNNYAICAIYLRRVHEAVSQLELLIQQDPARHLSDPIVFNLCTLYDLTCAPDLSTNKKKVLTRLAAIYNIDDPLLHSKSFRLTI